MRSAASFVISSNCSQGRQDDNLTLRVLTRKKVKTYDVTYEQQFYNRRQDTSVPGHAAPGAGDRATGGYWYTEALAGPTLALPQLERAN